MLASSRLNRPFSASTSATDRFTGTAVPSTTLSFPARFSLIQFHRLESGMPNRFAAPHPPIDSLSLTASTLNSSVYCRFGTDFLLSISPSVHQKVISILMYVKPGQGHEPGHYTWWRQWGGTRERNVGWRTDYVLASPTAMKRLNAAFIWPNERGSDHCPGGVDIDL